MLDFFNGMAYTVLVMKIRDLEQLVRDTENQYKYAKLRLSVIKNRLDVSIARYIFPP